MEGIIKQLSEIQTTLKAPKGQYNSFGRYKYRSCEDILESVKPLLQKDSLVITITDEVVLIGDRYYIKATAKISNGKEEITNTAYAREALTKKGMDESQITGATSSYARKYALNGLLLIDDTKDADSTNTGNTGKEPEASKALTPPKPRIGEKPIEDNTTIAQNQPETATGAKKSPEVARYGAKSTLSQINAKFKELKAKLGEEDFRAILKSFKCKSLKDVKTTRKAQEIISVMEETLATGEKLDEELDQEIDNVDI